MATLSNRITTKDLTVYLDKNNLDSYAGEPADNLYSEAASRFTTSGGWGTYHDRNYNSSAYFNVTVTDVTNNIVTFSSWDSNETPSVLSHDVIMPQTTGGGVNAGQRYFVKMVDTDKFTLHAYDATNNGSVGYINTATGKHKAWDSMYLNGGTPISISSSGFPTMWWGPPHIPNSHLIKEAKESGGPTGGPFVRLWSGSGDGGSSRALAYGTYYDHSKDITYTISWWYRGSWNYAPLNFYQSSYSGSGIWSPSSPSVYPSTEWQRVEYTATWTVPNDPTAVLHLYWWLYHTAPAGSYVDIADFQMEENSHATKWVGDSSREITDTWKNLSLGGPHDSNVDLNNVTFSSTNITGTDTNNFSFDGTDDYATINDTITTVKTVSAWVKTNSSSSGMVWGPWTNGVDNGFGVSNYKAWFWGCQSADTNEFSIYSTTTLNSGEWYHIAATINGSTAKLYLDGVEEATITRSYDIAPWGGSATTLGRRGGSVSQLYFNGEMGKIAVYDRPLTADEIKQNYKAHKTLYI